MSVPDPALVAQIGSTPSPVDGPATPLTEEEDLRRQIAEAEEEMRFIQEAEKAMYKAIGEEDQVKTQSEVARLEAEIASMGSAKI